MIHVNIIRFPQLMVEILRAHVNTQILTKTVPLFWKWSSVGQIWSQIKKLIFLENGEGWGGVSNRAFDRKTLIYYSIRW